ncbi:MAG: RNA polymerase subunit sigma-70 [Alphaproteobacteria bacterium PA2]|nr:MAG: RNA polymerase subunit sigma-70 [Alphaproteobacteria bacterium PA2]
MTSDTQGAGTTTEDKSKAFKADLVAIIPALRAFARSLCGNPALADDLVQETMLKAWTARGSYIVGTNFKAWTFRILRNAFYSTWRKSRRLTSIDEEHHAKTARAIENVETAMELAEVSSAIRQLPIEQREALILIAAGGFNYDEVARIIGVAVGTVKSRVSRGRSTLAVLMTKRHNRRTPTPVMGAAAGLIRDSDQLVKRAAATP